MFALQTEVAADPDLFVAPRSAATVVGRLSTHEWTDRSHCDRRPATRDRLTHENHSDGEALLIRRTITLGTTLILVAACAVTRIVALAPSAEAANDTKLARAEAQISVLRNQLAAERRSHRTNVNQLRRTRGPARTVSHALTIASATYGVPVARLRRVAMCESTLDPNARNGRYVGLFQFGTPLWNTTPYRRFSRTDPYAGAGAAAWALKRGMAGHWPVCGRR